MRARSLSLSHTRYRINGNLAVARSIGDKFERPCVTDEVEIRTLPLDPEGDQFIVVATDGLWDVMSSAEAVEFVHARMSSTGVSDVNTLEVVRGRRRGNSGGAAEASGVAAGDDSVAARDDRRRESLKIKPEWEARPPGGLWRCLSASE